MAHEKPSFIDKGITTIWCCVFLRKIKTNSLWSCEKENKKGDGLLHRLLLRIK
jgi:hypothetical protein